jgi:hypothetical protein
MNTTKNPNYWDANMVGQFLAEIDATNPDQTLKDVRSKIVDLVGRGISAGSLIEYAQELMEKSK